LIFYAKISCLWQADYQTDENMDDSLVRSGLMHFHSIPSATGGISRLVCARIRKSGIELAPLLLKAGLTVEQIDNRSARLKVQSQIRFLELAAAALQDDFLGFHLARDFDLREIGLLYYVLASSEILADALYKAERYSGLSMKGFHCDFAQVVRLRLLLVTLTLQGDRIVIKLNFG
jgi:hypothetical protein